MMEAVRLVLVHLFGDAMQHEPPVFRLIKKHIISADNR
jgi:hypothetical protein